DFGGADSVRPPLEIDAEEFIAVKGFKAKGKRISTFTIGSMVELEPTRFPAEPEPQDSFAQDDTEESSGLSEKTAPVIIQGDLFADDDVTENFSPTTPAGDGT
ncbi:MAG: hypothetical protein K2G52_04995, partial [Muribaculaceae bacterium]|nr:hypothetical protein [Muribaculaceae bacterium]